MWLLGLALAGPEITQHAGQTRWDYGDVEFEVPSDSVAADLALSGAHPVGALIEARAVAVRAWAATLPSHTRVEVLTNGATIRYAVRAPDETAEGVLAQAQAVGDAARVAFLAERGYEVAGDKVRPAHQRLVGEYADDVVPLAKALGSDEQSDTMFAANALRFVQNIPYETQRDGDTFRRPLAVLHGNLGDCDSKAVLYLALLKAHNPRLKTALFYVPGHLYVGVALRLPGTTMSVGGVDYVVAEPSGPGVLPIGELDERRKDVAVKDVRVVP